jgi:uracil-DNA glycosylase
LKTKDFVNCVDFPCLDTRRSSYLIPNIDIDPAKVSILLISEASPENPSDHYYTGPEALFARTTLLAFQDAGAKAQSVQDLVDMGVYLTTAVKCGKTGYGISTGTIQACSHLLYKEIDLFPNVNVYLLMGDVAIKAVNMIAKRDGDRVPSLPGQLTRSAAESLPSAVRVPCRPMSRQDRHFSLRKASAK